MKQFCCTIIILAMAVWGFSQPKTSSKNVGGSCEECEAVFEFGNAQLTSTATLPDFKESGPKMEVSGIIYQRDGKTPAAGVILYIYHTDQKGEYPTKGDETGWAKRHGYIRGWIKTDAEGRYKFYTLKPAPYPGRNAPAHIHATVKEPSVNAYWIDEYLFEGDPLLTASELASQRKRGGVGIIKIGKNSEGMLTAKRDIILGLNIPDY